MQPWSFWWWAAGLAWLLALAWLLRFVDALLHRGQVPDLLDPRYGLPAGDAVPALSVIVPALNEADAIAACLGSLLASQGVQLQILAVDDRSTDETGAIMDAIAAKLAEQPQCGPHSLTVLHIAELPTGWLGKPHAMALAARHATAPWLLFTDADGVFAPDALARCLRLVTQQQADHLVLLPTATHQSWGERMMLGAIQAVALWGPRLWKVSDPQAFDSLGVGCFNLLRRPAYDAIGGFEAIRMEVVEDLRLGYLVKDHGFGQRVAFGDGLLRLHWAQGALGIVRNLEKNFFAICRYQLPLLVAAATGLALLTLAPFAGLLGPAAVRLPSVLTLCVLLAAYALNRRRSGISLAYALLFPAAACLLLYAMLRSAVVTLARGGVTWRGTFYPLAELRRHAGPLSRWQPRRRA